MTEAQATGVSVEIFEAADSNTARHAFLLTLQDASGQPVAGKDILISLDGSGSLNPQSAGSETRRETDAKGQARITWYRRSIYGRDVKATLTIKPADPAHSVTVEEVDPETAVTSFVRQTKLWI